MSLVNPALVTRGGARRLPRAALLLLCAAYVLPGLFGRDPWRNADLTAYGLMSAMAASRTSWGSPELGAVPVDVAAFPHWLGAASIWLLGPLVGDPVAARIPFALLLVATLALTWYATFHLARTEAAQPVPFAFGGEAAPVDYARAIADAALLALIATLGLLQLGHETTPELAQLCAACGVLWGLAAAPYRPRAAPLAVAAGLVGMAASGAPAMATALGVVGALVCARSNYPQVRRQAAVVIVATIAAATVAVVARTWRYRVALAFDLGDAADIARQWAWFLWPVWPAALWTLWRWRRHLLHRHVAVPMSLSVTALVTNVVTGGSDRALLIGLPGLAILAAFALPTLRRGATAAIDWFSMCFFTICAIAIWVIYVAMQTGTPAKPAANVVRLLPGFEAPFDGPELVVAILSTLVWLWLVRWRTGRHREAVWKSMVLPAGGVALCWMLLMTLWLPALDYARSLRPWVDRLAPHLADADCLVAPGLGLPQRAALEVHGRWPVDARPDAAARCRVMISVSPAPPHPLPPAGWDLQAQVRRPTDRDELTLLWRRRSP